MPSHIRVPAATFNAAVWLAAMTLVAAPRVADAQSTTITFAANACTGAGNSGQGYNSYNGPFDVQGYRFSGSPAQVFATPCAGDATYAGTTTFYGNNVGNITTLSRTSGLAFSLNSIDLATLLVFGQPQTVTFSGVVQGGGTVTQSFNVPGQSSGAPVLATYTFLPTFANLTSVQISANVQPYYQFTNVRVTAVPELGTAALLLAGLALLSRARRPGQPALRRAQSVTHA